MAVQEFIHRHLSSYNHWEDTGTKRNECHQFSLCVTFRHQTGSLALSRSLSKNSIYLFFLLAKCLDSHTFSKKASVFICARNQVRSVIASKYMRSPRHSCLERGSGGPSGAFCAVDRSPPVRVNYLWAYDASYTMKWLYTVQLASQCNAYSSCCMPALGNMSLSSHRDVKPKCAFWP